jgi:hypothetical protein
MNRLQVQQGAHAALRQFAQASAANSTAFPIMEDFVRSTSEAINHSRAPAFPTSGASSGAPIVDDLADTCANVACKPIKRCLVTGFNHDWLARTNRLPRFEDNEIAL